MQEVELGDCQPPPGGDRDDYTRQITKLDVESGAFFLELKVQTNGPRSELPGQAPFVAAAASFGPVGYHITVAEDQVKLLRDALLPILFFDLDPATPHTFRLETFSEDLYVWYIDGSIVDSGSPEGPYPSFFPVAGWGSRTYFTDSTSRLKYLRMGGIPIDASADFNSDGQVDEFEVFYVDECIQRSAAGEPADPSCQWSDINGDNTVDCADWQIIKETLWTGASDPPPIAPCDPVDDVETVPAVSHWGLTILALLLATLAKLTHCQRVDAFYHTLTTAM